MTSPISVRMCKFSALVYSDTETVAQEIERLNYEDFRWFDKRGTQSFVAYSSNYKELVVCFRGTQPSEASDVLADLKAWPKKAREKGRVHYGFAKACDCVYDEMVEYINSLEIADDTKVICTGHSLGAAIATIVASRLDADELYTFGSPRVGNNAFVKEMNNDNIKHYRFVNNNDVVTTVPFAFMGYRHHGELSYINYYGNIRKMTTWQRIKDKFRGRWRALKKGQPFDGAFDHSIDLYYEKIAKNVSPQG